MLSLQICYTQLELIWMIWWNPVTSASFYQMQHGPFPLPTIQYSKPHQVQQNLDSIHTWLEEIGEHRQWLIDLNTAGENKGRIDHDYQGGQKLLVWNGGILHKAEFRYLKEPWTITSVHTNRTIRVQCGDKSERINIWREISLKKIYITSKT